MKILSSVAEAGRRVASVLRRVPQTLSRAAASARLRRLSVHAFAALVIGGMLFLATRGYRDDSPTEDEWAHTIRGISYWQQNDTRLHYAHPPLGNAITGLAAGLDPANPRVTETKRWKDANVGLIALEYIQKDYPRAREQLFRTRLVVMGLGAVLAAYVFYFCLSFFGFPTAAAALFLVAFNPTVIAQARYVTTDLPMACMTAIAVGEFIRYLTGRGGRASVVLMPIAASAALLTKHSGALLLPMFLVIGLVAAVRGAGRFAGRPLRSRLGRLGVHSLIAGVIVLFSMNAAFKFDRTFMSVEEILAAPEPQYQVSSGYKNQLLEKLTPLPRLPQKLRLPVPYTYIFGVACVSALNKGGFPSYFMGKPMQKGHIAYFPMLLAIKNPPGLLALLLVGVFLLRGRLRRLSLPVVVVASVAGLFLLASMRSHLNMGVRHALPIVPLLSILGGRAFGVAWELAGERESLRLLLAGAAGSTLASAALAAPLYLGYFNFLAGSSEHAHDISIYGEDWGQDRAAFARFVKERNIAPLYYDTQTETRKTEIDHFKVQYTPLRCKTTPRPHSWVGIHALVVKRGKNGKCNKWLKGLTPVVRIHEHVYLYWIGDPPPKGARGRPAPPPPPEPDEPDDPDDPDEPDEPSPSEDAAN